MDDPVEWAVGDAFDVTVGAVAHGGHCVARHQGRVMFIRHALPGEQVVARITAIGKGGRFVQADAVTVLEASPHRVEAPCPFAGPGRCGGCDFQHVGLTAQRDLKTSVVHEQFRRLAGLDLTDHLNREVACEPMPHEVDGLGWRTRVEFAVDSRERAGLRRHHSHDVIAVDDCLIAHPRLQAPSVLARRYPRTEAVDVISSASGVVRVPIPARRGAAHGQGSATGPDAEVPTVTEQVPLPGGDVAFELSARGFWQVHPEAAQTFARTALELLAPAPGERAADLYSGVGLFTAALAQAVGRTGRVTAVEADHRAVQDARTNLAPWPHARVRSGRVDRAVRDMARSHTRVDLVVLDPPRVGAGKAVLRDVALLGTRAVVYVACDPAALARDTAYLRDLGYELVGLRVFDAFPMTHHVECLAHFEPVRETGNAE
ncbi:MAG: TRAM domain-containing protein [Ornithinimicrobium sp.]